MGVVILFRSLYPANSGSFIYSAEADLRKARSKIQRRSTKPLPFPGFLFNGSFPMRDHWLRKIESKKGIKIEEPGRGLLAGGLVTAGAGVQPVVSSS